MSASEKRAFGGANGSVLRTRTRCPCRSGLGKAYRSVMSAIGSATARGPEMWCDMAASPSPHVDVYDLDGVVSVAEAVPGRDLRLRIAGGVGRAGAEGVPADVVRLPVERPFLPLVWACGWLELGRVPVAFAGEADVDTRDGSRARPGLAAYGVRAGADSRAVSGVGDPCPHAHEADGLARPVGPLVHVVARLELAGEPLGQDVDPLQPFHRGDGVPVGHDESERGAV